MNLVVYFYSTITMLFIVVISVLLSFSDAAITHSEHEELYRSTTNSTHFSKGRFITSSLTAIKDLALSLSSGVLPNFFPQLASRYNDEATHKVSKIISDKEIDEDEDEDPLCVIATEEATLGEDRSSKNYETPIVNCVVIVKNRESEDASTYVNKKNSDSMRWHPTFNTYDNENPYMQWFNSDSVYSAPIYPSLVYYPSYAFGYQQVMQRMNTFASPKKSQKIPTRFSRTIKLLSPQSAIPQLEYKFAMDGTDKQRIESHEMELKDKNKQLYNDVTKIAIMSKTPESVQTNELSNVVYQQVLYPQYGYQSHYPKVAYAHPLPYRAPVYVPSTRKPPIATKFI